MSAADGALNIIGTLLRLVVTTAEAASRHDIAKPVKEILAHFGTELRRVAESEADLAAEGDGRPPAVSR